MQNKYPQSNGNLTHKYLISNFCSFQFKYYLCIQIKKCMNMKIAITSKGNNLNSDFDLRFGRAMYFCILDKNTGETRFLANKQMNANGGAGTKTAELMAELDVSKIISGDFGPKAKSLLEELNIQMIVLNETNITIKEIINKFQN